MRLPAAPPGSARFSCRITSHRRRIGPAADRIQTGFRFQAWSASRDSGWSRVGTRSPARYPGSAPRPNENNFDAQVDARLPESAAEVEIVVFRVAIGIDHHDQPTAATQHLVGPEVLEMTSSRKVDGLARIIGLVEHFRQQGPEAVGRAGLTQARRVHVRCVIGAASGS